MAAAAEKTPAVLRVKRKRGVDPAEALILSCKRLRSETGSESEAGAEAGTSAKAPGKEPVEDHVFKLAATLSSQNEPVKKCVQDAIARERAASLLRPSSGSKQRILKSLQVSQKISRQERRYRLVSQRRPYCVEEEIAQLSISDSGNPKNDEEDSEKAEEKKEKESDVAGPSSSQDQDQEFQVFDIVHEETEDSEGGAAAFKISEPETILCNSMKMLRESLLAADSNTRPQDEEEDFEYDIYYRKTTIPIWIDGVLSVRRYSEECELIDEQELEEIFDDEDDENSEDNWRNEYPDETIFEDDDDSGSDEESRSHSDEDEGSTQKEAWDKYHGAELKDCDSDSVQELDPD
ncbi:probable RNA polymerase II nuclear localization protein SLC7A6OS [Ornithorhynchus anatinus]|uniref:Probable RNA polymerase II nuclear localization protein SLC7A6OS n=1 Tax=Ornithorhynchus anatinus TaxID=9258 RepID=F6TG10_ORNAN|nr:probable RNA polymerase II nuclear localization protein SLC7A6OS [Ornithorhynchus anatinus]